MVKEKTNNAPNLQTTLPTRKPVMNEKAVAKMLNIMSTNATTTRSELLKTLLDSRIDMDYECGYPNPITTTDYNLMYDRYGIAARVVNVWPQETWKVEPEIYENEDDKKTEFEAVLKELREKKNLYDYLSRVDILSGIGRFGLILFGINDGKDLSEAVDGVDVNVEQVSGKKVKRELLYMKVFDESAVQIGAKETDTKSPRFGYPLSYNITFQDGGDSSSKTTKTVHWTRVVHIADNRLMSEMYGVPRMKPVFNYLMDLRKVLSGCGEMFWKGAFPGYSFEVDPKLQDVTVDEDSIKEQIEKYVNSMQRYLSLTGVHVNSLEPQVSDPTSHFTVLIKAVCITMDIPYRIFLGTEQAQLASSQDKATWSERVAGRQNKYITSHILRPVIDRLVVYGILPQVEDYIVKWPDLETPSDIEKTTVAKEKTEAMSKYVAGGVAGLIAPQEFLTMVLGFTNEEAEQINEAVIAEEGQLVVKEDPEPDLRTEIKPEPKKE